MADELEAATDELAEHVVLPNAIVDKCRSALALYRGEQGE